MVFTLGNRDRALGSRAWKGAGKAEAPVRRAGRREAVFTSVRSEWLVPRSRPPRPRVFTRREQHGLRARGRGGAGPRATAGA